MLVIIGLVVGGIFVGKDLIWAAEVRAVMSQVEQYSAAVNTFRLKFNDLPGDMTSAAAAQWGFQPRSGGNGDGIINDPAVAPGDNFRTATVESECFWSDLAAAKLINYTPRNGCPGPPGAIISGAALDDWFPPTEALGGRVHASYIQNTAVPPSFSQGHYFYVGYIGLIDSMYAYTCCDGGIANIDPSFFAYPILSPPELFAIDTKYDDAMPRAGRVRASGYGGGGIVIGELVPWAPSPDRCTHESDVTKYNLTSTKRTCDMMIQAGF